MLRVALYTVLPLHVVRVFSCPSPGLCHRFDVHNNAFTDGVAALLVKMYERFDQVLVNSDVGNIVTIVGQQVNVVPYMLRPSATRCPVLERGKTS